MAMATGMDAGTVRDPQIKEQILHIAEKLAEHGDVRREVWHAR
jgi:hypothetical protein